MKLYFVIAITFKMNLAYFRLNTPYAGLQRCELLTTTIQTVCPCINVPAHINLKIH